MIEIVLPFLGFNSLDKNDFEFIGTAFLYKSDLLITAGHNIEKKVNKKYKRFGTIFKDRIIHLNELIFLEYDNKFLTSGERKDLAIFRFDNNFTTTFDFYHSDLNSLDEIIIVGYRDYPLGDTKPEIHSSNVTYPKQSYKNFPETNFKARLTEYLNCFGISKKLEPGYSGCPIFKNNLICGMVSYGFYEKIIGARQPKDLETTCIKSMHISNIVNVFLTEN